jgi:hypothetical protein
MTIRVFITGGTFAEEFNIPRVAGDWREVVIHFGEKEGTALGKLPRKSLVWWIENWVAKKYRGKWEDEVILLDAALCLASAEIGGE